MIATVGIYRRLTKESIATCAEVSRGEATSLSHIGGQCRCIGGIWRTSGKGKSKMICVKKETVKIKIKWGFDLVGQIDA